MTLVLIGKGLVLRGGIQIYTYIYIHLLYAYSCMHAYIISTRELFLAHVFFVQTVCFSCILTWREQNFVSGALVFLVVTCNSELPRGSAFWAPQALPKPLKRPFPWGIYPMIHLWLWCKNKDDLTKTKMDKFVKIDTFQKLLNGFFTTPWSDKPVYYPYPPKNPTAGTPPKTWRFPCWWVFVSVMDLPSAQDASDTQDDCPHQESPDFFRNEISQLVAFRGRVKGKSLHQLGMESQCCHRGQPCWRFFFLLRWVCLFRDTGL